MQYVIPTIRSMATTMGAISFYLFGKSIEFWFFQVENWSNIVSFWWIAPAIMFFLLSAILAFSLKETS